MLNFLINPLLGVRDVGIPATLQKIFPSFVAMAMAISE